MESGRPVWRSHWSTGPARLRGIASGLLQGGFGWGFILSGVVFTYVYPQLEDSGELAWRSMLWLGIVPAFLVFWIRSRVAESPVWLERQLHLREHPIREETSVLRIFRRGIVRTTLQTSLLMASLMFSFYSLTYWYATFLREAGRTTLGLDHRRAAPGNCGSVAWTRDERTSAGRDRSVRGNRRFAGKDAVVAH